MSGPILILVPELPINRIDPSEVFTAIKHQNLADKLLDFLRRQLELIDRSRLEPFARQLDFLFAHDHFVIFSCVFLHLLVNGWQVDKRL